MIDYIFVSDYFLEDYVGGAELTSAALYDYKPSKVFRVRSKDLSRGFVEKHHKKKFIFGNFFLVPNDLLLFFAKNTINYYILEYDFKFCKYRSPKKHISFEEACTCANNQNGKLISLFFKNSSCLFFMSEKQKGVYEEKFKFLKNNEMHTLSSVFSQETLYYLDATKNNKKNQWAILDSNSWIKNTKDTIKYAQENNLNFKLLGGLTYKNMLKEISQLKGLIFLPRSSDTCPRIVIEAKLLNCELILNENVLHKDEKWFCDNNESILNYLKQRPEFFWSKVNSVERYYE